MGAVGQYKHGWQAQPDDVTLDGRFGSDGQCGLKQTMWPQTDNVGIRGGETLTGSDCPNATIMTGNPNLEVDGHQKHGAFSAYIPMKEVEAFHSCCAQEAKTVSL